MPLRGTSNAPSDASAGATWSRSRTTASCPARATASAAARPATPPPAITKRMPRFCRYLAVSRSVPLRYSAVSESLVSHHPEVGPLLSERAQRAKLVEAMVQVVAEKGYEDATVADIVRAAR